MKIVYRLEDIPTFTAPIALTIGTFDGVHKGHRRLLEKVQKKASRNGTAVVLSFSPSPIEVLHPEKKSLQLMPTQLRLLLLEKMKIDLVILLPFTHELSLQTYEEFLEDLHHKLPFNFLILGKDSSFGKDRLGNEKNVTSWAAKKNCSVEYCPHVETDGERISSSQIRKCVKEGNLLAAAKLWESPFFLFLPPPQKNVSSSLFSWKLENQCLPPDGLYELSFSYPLSKKQKTFLGFVSSGNLKIKFSSSLFLSDQYFILFFLKKRSCMPWLESLDNRDKSPVLSS